MIRLRSSLFLLVIATAEDVLRLASGEPPANVVPFGAGRRA